MLLLWASLPLDREVPSLRIRTGVSDIIYSVSDYRVFLLPKINICREIPQNSGKTAPQNPRENHLK